MGNVTEFSGGTLTLGTLHHFGIASAALADAHRQWLNRKVVPVLKRGGSVTIVGQTSRSGSEKFNKRLSKKRADAVRAYLEKQAKRCFEYLYAHGEGESAATLAGQTDGSEDGNFRSVIVIAHVYPEPPTPPPPIRVKPKPKKRVSDVWLGIGEIHSGDLLVAGYYNWNGRAYRLSADESGHVDYVDLTSHGWKLGPGLGGSGGAVAIFARGIKKPSKFKDGFNWGGADFDLAIGAQLGSALKSLKGVGTVVKTLNDYKKLNYVGQELLKNKAFLKKGVYTIPIPLAGAGLHVWVGRKYGEIMLNSTGSTKIF